MKENRMRLVPIILILTGAALLAYAAAAGQGSIHIFLFIPIISLHGVWGFLGALAFFSGFFMLPFFSRQRPVTEAPANRVGEHRARKSVGGVVLIGPIPIIFGKGDKSVMVFAIIAALVLMLFLLVLTIE